ncbi:MAG TPA: hypothetical protein VF143_06745 [Candidatus Nanopelagicales bacterium]
MRSQGGSVQLPPTVLPLNRATPRYRARLEATDGVLRWETPRTLLGLLRVGTRRVALPLADITDVRSRLGVHPARLAVGLALLAAILTGPPAWAIPVLAAPAGLLLMMAPDAELVVRTTDGRTRRLAICVLHRMDVGLVAAALADLTGSPRDAAGRVRP